VKISLRQRRREKCVIGVQPITREGGGGVPNSPEDIFDERTLLKVGVFRSFNQLGPSTWPADDVK
jgi:hypothetical protein